jgi:hypothetical protein
VIRLTNGEVAHFLFASFSFSFLVMTLLRNTLVDLSSLCLKRRRLPQGSAFWGFSLMKNFFMGEYPSPNFQKAFCVQIEKL